MHHVNKTAGVDDVKDGVIHAKRCLIFGETIVLFAVSEDLDLNNFIVTMSLITQFMMTMISDMAPPLMNSSMCPLFSP